MQDGGTNWRTIRALNVNTGKTLEHEVNWARYTSIAWGTNKDHGQDQADFRHLLTYLPYHNIQPGTACPAILVTTADADADDCVVTGHTFYCVAALQAAAIGPRPQLVHIGPRFGQTHRPDHRGDGGPPGLCGALDGLDVSH